MDYKYKARLIPPTGDERRHACSSQGYSDLADLEERVRESASNLSGAAEAEVARYGCAKRVSVHLEAWHLETNQSRRVEQDCALDEIATTASVLAASLAETMRRLPSSPRQRFTPPPPIEAATVLRETLTRARQLDSIARVAGAAASGDHAGALTGLASAIMSATETTEGEDEPQSLQEAMAKMLPALDKIAPGASSAMQDPGFQEMFGKMFAGLAPKEGGDGDE